MSLSLRAAGHLLAAAVLLGGAAWLGWPGSLRAAWRPFVPASAEVRPRIARRFLAYRIDPRRPTLFRFTQPVRVTRIVTQPILAPASASPGEGWTYALRAELLDEAGGVLETRLVYARTVLIEPSGKRRGPLRYYRGSAVLVAPSDEVRIAAQRPFAAIRLVAVLAPRDVVAIDVRVGEQRPLIASVAASAFVRMSPDERLRLAAASAFPPELLTPPERIAIAVNQWRPVGPVGIDGRDYRSAVLYEEEATAGEAAEDGEVLADLEVGG